MPPKRATDADELTPLQTAALNRFADQGYNGASLAQIAGDVGIKTPSIYAHFKGKDELFLSLIPPVSANELRLTREALSGASPLPGRLHAYLENLGERFESTPHMRFLLHAAYMPPVHLLARVKRDMDAHMSKHTEIVAEVFSGITNVQLSADTLATAYVGIIDSLQSEMIYIGKENFRKRLAAMWAVFQLALRGKKK